MHEDSKYYLNVMTWLVYSVLIENQAAMSILPVISFLDREKKQILLEPIQTTLHCLACDQIHITRVLQP